MNHIINILLRFGTYIQQTLKELDYLKSLNFATLFLLVSLIFASKEPSLLFDWERAITSAFTEFNAERNNIYIQLVILFPLTFFLYVIAIRKEMLKTIQYIILSLFTYFIVFVLVTKIDVVLNLFIGILSLSLFWVFGLVVRFNDEKSEIFGLKKAVSQYVSPQIMNRVLTNPKSLKLGGNSRNMTVLFSDIRNFTSISEKVKAKKLIEFVNEYFNSVTKTILKNAGTIDKFAGDSLLAFWNAPLKEQNHAFIACTTALQIREDLKQFNEEQKLNGSGPKIATGIGINTGEITVGNVGSKDRFDYTVIGDEVNIAARLESMTKLYKVPILLGHNTVLELKKTGMYSKFSIRLLDIVKAKGKKKQVGVYELMGKRERSCEDLADVYEDAFTIYQKGNFANASKAFIEILSRIDDHPSKMMLVRCYQFIEDPPNGDWDGIWEWGKK